jgi:hypothetical protein
VWDIWVPNYLWTLVHLGARGASKDNRGQMKVKKRLNITINMNEKHQISTLHLIFKCIHNVYVLFSALDESHVMHMAYFLLTLSNIVVIESLNTALAYCYHNVVILIMNTYFPESFSVLASMFYHFEPWILETDKKQ